MAYDGLNGKVLKNEVNTTGKRENIEQGPMPVVFCFVCTCVVRARFHLKYSIVLGTAWRDDLSDPELR